MIRSFTTTPLLALLLPWTCVIASCLSVSAVHSGECPPHVADRIHECNLKCSGDPPTPNLFYASHDEFHEFLYIRHCYFEVSLLSELAEHPDERVSNKARWILRDIAEAEALEE
jgi:hypothetical protein